MSLPVNLSKCLPLLLQGENRILSSLVENWLREELTVFPVLWLMTGNECAGKMSKHKIRISDFVTYRDVSLVGSKFCFIEKLEINLFERKYSCLCLYVTWKVRTLLVMTEENNLNVKSLTSDLWFWWYKMCHQDCLINQ